MSTIPWPSQKPHWLSGNRPCSRWARIQLTSKLASTFPAVERREIPQWLPQHYWFPFLLYRWTMVASLNSYGTALEVQAGLKSSVSLQTRFHPLSMYSSPRMASDPGPLLVERDLTVLLTSSTVGELTRLAFITACGRWAMASSLMEKGQLSTLLKCSVHLPSFVLVCQQSRAISAQHWGWSRWLGP